MQQFQKYLENFHEQMVYFFQILLFVVKFHEMLLENIPNGKKNFRYNDFQTLEGFS